jgi:hypothetical protein
VLNDCLLLLAISNDTLGIAFFFNKSTPFWLQNKRNMGVYLRKRYRKRSRNTKADFSHTALLILGDNCSNVVLCGKDCYLFPHLIFLLFSPQFMVRSGAPAGLPFCS